MHVHESDRIVSFLAGLSFHILLVGATSRQGTQRLLYGNELQNTVLILMQVLAIFLLLFSWILTQMVMKNIWFVFANLTISLGACKYRKLLSHSLSLIELFELPDSSGNAYHYRASTNELKRRIKSIRCGDSLCSVLLCFYNWSHLEFFHPILNFIKHH